MKEISKNKYINYTQTEEIRISVAMATYNGEQFVEQQLVSILEQLRNDDELIISDNMSTDHTLEILKRYAAVDKRIKIFVCEKKGVTHNFSNAISQCKGDIIFLSDQDDVWMNNKVAVIMQNYERGKKQFFIHGKNITDKDLDIIRYDSTELCKQSVFDTIKRMRYTGCCTAFDKELLQYFMPIPANIAHDWWIALLACKYANIVKIDTPLISYRRHGNNASRDKSRNIRLIVKDRVVIFCYYLARIFAIKSRKKR